MADIELDLLKPGAVLKGRWEIVRRIKIGGMGAVYEVTDQNLGARRALKVMLPGLVTESMLQRFRQEASIPGRIESKHVVDILELGVDEERGLPFLVMELLKGEDLATRLERGRLSPEEALFCLHGASLALDCAHAADVIHRDLKPENLFVTKRKDSTVEDIKVLDFGIAKIVEDSLLRPRTTLNLGTPLYMSPEQILGNSDLDCRSDTYALGHVAFTLLTGHAYWEPELESMASTPFLTRVSQGAPEPASVRATRFDASLPPVFDAWFAKATAVSASERFESASELVTALAEALSVPVPIRPSWTSQPSGRDATREPPTQAIKTSSTRAVSRSAARPHERAWHPPWLFTGAVIAAGLAGYWYVWLRAPERISPDPVDLAFASAAPKSASAPVVIAPVVSAPVHEGAASSPADPTGQPKNRPNPRPILSAKLNVLPPPKPRPARSLEDDPLSHR